MQINGKGRIDPNAPGSVTPGTADRKESTRAADKVAAAPERPKQDTVSFSDEARALASGTSTRAASNTERVEEVRQRVLLGAWRPCARPHRA